MLIIAFYETQEIVWFSYQIIKKKKEKPMK